MTTIDINNGGYSGYGPGFWGAGHDPYTWQVSNHASACMATMAKAVGFYGEDVTEPSEVIPALRRAFDEAQGGDIAPSQIAPRDVRLVDRAGLIARIAGIGGHE